MLNKSGPNKIIIAYQLNKFKHETAQSFMLPKENFEWY